MNKSMYLAPVLAMGMATLAFGQTAPSKVGIIHIQNAIMSTRDGQKALADLQARFGPKKAELEKKQAAIAALRDQLQKGSATLSDEAKQKLMRDIDQGTKSFNRDTEDAQAEVEQEEGKIYQSIGQRVVAVINKYARDNGYSLVIDVSNPQMPVVFAADSIDMTRDIITLYDKNAPGATSAAPAAPAPAATAPAPAARPPAPAPKKK